VTALEQVNAQPRRIDVSRVVLLPLAGVLWLFGWFAGWTWRAVTWIGAAIMIGWTDSRAGSRRR
jgi:hypothetical protein